MKRMRRLSAALLAVILALGMTAAGILSQAVPARAASGKTGSVTINGVHAGETYTLYRILDLSDYPADSDGYLYKAANDDKGNWSSFVAASTYLHVDHDDFVTLDSSIDEDEEAAAITAFAKEAIAYAKDTANGITAQSSKAAGAQDTSLTFNGLPIGYYVLDSSLGTNPISFSVDNSGVTTIDEKNAAPDVEKKIIEEGNQAIENSANIGDTVIFQTTITVAKGAKAYVLHDKMEEGLTFDGVASVGLIKSGQAEVTVAEGNYTVTTGDKIGADETACTFHVTFVQNWLDTLAAGDKIVVHYTAVLNEDATTGANTNDNETWLKYGDNSETTHRETATSTYQIQIVKTDGGNSAGTEYQVLSGAKFELHKENEKGELVYFKKTSAVGDNPKYDTYTVCGENEQGATEEILAGTPIVKGLEEGTYVLVETDPPADYNRAQPTTITVNADNIIVNGTISDGVFKPNGTEGIHVINHEGSSLPTTGGIGTTLFYVIGALLVLGAGGALIFLNRKTRRQSGKRARR